MLLTLYVLSTLLLYSESRTNSGSVDKIKVPVNIERVTVRVDGLVGRLSLVPAGWVYHGGVDALAGGRAAAVVEPVHGVGDHPTRWQLPHGC